MAKPQLLATVFSDYICPFCYVGNHRLDQLRDEFELRINWCFLEIHPETPATGKPVEQLPYGESLMQRKMANLATLAAADGLAIANNVYTANSHNALLLAEATKEDGREIFYALHLNLFRAYFGGGRNIGDREVLKEIATESTVPAATLARAWSDPRYENRLRQNLAAAHELGITNTPTYIFSNRVIQGAVSVETLRDAAHEAFSSA